MGPNITTKLVASFLVIVLLMIPLIYYITDTSEDALKESEGENSIKVAEGIINRIDYSIYNRIHEINLLSLEGIVTSTLASSNLEFDAMDDREGYINQTDGNWTSAPKEEITPFIADLMNNELSSYIKEKYIRHFEKDHGYRAYAHIYFTNKFGAVVSLTEKTSTFDWSSSDWWTGSRDNDSFVSNIKVCEMTGANVISIAQVVHDANGTFLGVVYGMLDITSLAQESKFTLEKEGDYEVRMITGDGRMIYSSETYRILEDISQDGYFQRISMENDHFETHIHGEDKIISYAHSIGYSEFDGFDWILIIEHDKHSVLEPAAQLRDDMNYLSFIIITISVLLAFVLARSFTTPIRKFQSMAEEIAEGNLDMRVDIHSNDEIGELSESFNKMTGKLQESYTGLEDKVFARTAELAKTNKDLVEETSFSTNAINSLPGVFYLINQEGKFSRWNDTFEQVSGYSGEEMGAMSPLDLFQGEDKELIGQRIQMVFTDGQANAEADLCTKDGKRIPFYFTGLRTMLKDTPYVIGVGIDISEKKIHEREREELIHQMGERIKEQQCIYSIADSIRTQEDIQDVFRDVIKAIPQGWQYSDITQCRILFDGVEYSSSARDFQKSDWAQKTLIIVHGNVRGTIEVFYTEERPILDEGPFMTEERKLLEVISKSLGEAVERRLSEKEKVRAMGERAAIVDNMADSLVIADPDLVVRDVNPAWIVLTGHSRDEMIGNSIKELLPRILKKEEIPIIGQKLEMMLEGNEPEPFTMTFVHKDGGEVHVAAAIRFVRDENNVPLYSIVNLKDITPIREAEKEILKFQKLVERAGSGIGLADLEGNIKYVNKHLLTLLEEDSVEDVRKKKFMDYYPEFMHDRIETEIMPTVMTEGKWTGECMLQSTNGSLIPTLENFFLIYDEDGKPMLLADSITDITEIKDAEGKLRKTLMELTRSNQELEQFAYVASHDLQEPLRKIKNFSELFAQKYSGNLDDKADKYISYITGGATRMQNLIQDLLIFSRVSTRGKPFGQTNLNDVLNSAMENLEYSIKKVGATIDHDELPNLNVDRSQMSQVFQNIVGNSLKFHGEEKPIIKIRAEEKEEEWLFSVSDNGIGLDMEFAEKIFTVFQRLHGRTEYEGTGIGLAVCKKIIERHKGKIWVESESGKGATFNFTIPKHTKQEELKQ